MTTAYLMFPAYFMTYDYVCSQDACVAVWIAAVLRLFIHLVRMIETVVALAARVETIRDFKIYDGKPLRRRRSNRIIRRRKQRESVIFSPKGNLYTVLVLYTTPAWAFSRLQDDVNSRRGEQGPVVYKSS